MNKTVNINLAGIFFHIDEDAYLKLQRYLDAIKRSFTDSQGRSEIIADIEARIAELFNERTKHDKQVIGNKEVEEVIAIMGQPEDYLVDDEIFEDVPNAHQSHSAKKLYRDSENSYIAGVSSGLGHYLGLDAVWIRLLWVLLTLFSGGTFIFIYILFWILVPEAVTTSEKLTMKGEPVNISNIEKKIRDGFDNVSQTVSDTVKNIDLPKQGNRLKSSSKTFFDTIGDVFLFLLKIFAKFIGIILMIIGAATLISLIIGFFTVGIAGSLHVPGIDFFDAANVASIPIWLMSLLAFFAFAIPFFFIFYLGLKILVNNLKSIGNIAKFVLLGIWILCIVGLTVIGIKQASEFSEEAVVAKSEILAISAKDTLYVGMKSNTAFSKQFKRHHNDLKPVYDENDRKLLYSTDIKLSLKTTKDTVIMIGIDKSAKGNSYQNAKQRAEKINYSYFLRGNRLELDSYLTTAFENKYRDQEVEITLYIPDGTVLFVDGNTHSFRNIRFWYDSGNFGYDHPFDDGLKGHFLQIQNNQIKCLDCPIEEDFKLKIDLKGDDDSEFKIDENGVRINDESARIGISKDGLKSSSESVRVNIDSNGINIESAD
ncbi:MAG TPA: PspC domain-containing protein [Aquaticitalea sp.]|nr:PspC domain-containing protein [Aquaticitalea sp.]